MIYSQARSLFMPYLYSAALALLLHGLFLWWISMLSVVPPKPQQKPKLVTKTITLSPLLPSAPLQAASPKAEVAAIEAPKEPPPPSPAPPPIEEPKREELPLEPTIIEPLPPPPIVETELPKEEIIIPKEEPKKVEPPPPKPIEAPQPEIKSPKAEPKPEVKPLPPKPPEKPVAAQKPAQPKPKPPAQPKKEPPKQKPEEPKKKAAPPKKAATPPPAEKPKAKKKAPEPPPAQKKPAGPTPEQIAQQKAEQAKQRAEQAKQKELLRQAQENLEKIGQTRDKVSSSASTAPQQTALPQLVGRLEIDALPSLEGGGTLTLKEISYRDEVAYRLKKALKLPDYGGLKVKLTLERSGKIKSAKVISSESNKNREYVEKSILTVSFPNFGSNFEGASEYTFMITLHNAN